MATKTADLVAEALQLIEQGELSLEEGPRFYGASWVEINPAVELALLVGRAVHPPLVSQRPFQPLDKAASWNSLKAQLVAIPAPVVPPKAAFNLRRWFANGVSSLGRGLVGSGFGRVAMTAMVTALMWLGLSFVIQESQPGDALYRAKLGWDYLGEVSSLAPNERAQAALNYADRRLAELEKLSFVGRPSQIEEAQAQYLRGLDASMQYSNTKGFSQFVGVYSRLSEQRQRVARLKQVEYILGPSAKVSTLLNRLDTSVNYLSSRLPGSQPPPTTTPTPQTTTTPRAA